MDALVRALLPYVGRICGAIALDRGDDAMQETFIAVLRKLPTLREPAAVKGWARRIAVRESVRTVRGGDIVPVEDLAAPAISPRDDDIATEIDVRAVLEQLAPEQRAVLVLRDLDGLAEAEVASLLNVPEGTVKSRLHRARAAFAKRWSA